MDKELELMIGGPQGSGLDTTGQILTSSLAYIGYGVISDREYYSNITGKHSYIHMKVSPARVPYDLSYPVKLLTAIDAETLFHHYNDIDEKGFIALDERGLDTNLEKIVTIEGFTKQMIMDDLKNRVGSTILRDLVQYLEDDLKINTIILNYKEILDKLVDKYGVAASLASRYMSSIPMGVISGLMDIDAEAIEYGVRRRFHGRERIIEHNVFLITTIAEDIKSVYGSPLKLPKPTLDMKEIMVVSGNDIVAMGKVVGGLRFQSYYPITPAADESFFIEANQNLGDDKGGVVVFQTEDELAAIAAAIGGALTGVRTATATSGPGFSLMVEALGWAGNSEVPLVITYYQRGGPATGLPTRGGQSDLLFTMFASHGEFPRVVLASGDHEEAFEDSIIAFNLAEKYQLPVIHLLDKYLANSIATIRVPDIDQFTIDRGIIYNGNGDYVRFDTSKTISPRAFLGDDVIMWHTGNEHNEEGHNTEDPILRERMYRKRMEKLELIIKETPKKYMYRYYGPENPEVILLGWGFVKHVSISAIKHLEKEGYKAGYLHLKMFMPFPEEDIVNILNKVDRNNIIAVENNIMLQAAKATSLFTGIRIDRGIKKYTGRPIYLHELLEALRDLLNNRNKKEVVLTYGS